MKKEKSGAARIVEAIMSAALLNCRCVTVESLTSKVKDIVSSKFDIVDVSNEFDEYTVELLVGDTKVVIVFKLNDKQFITKIEVVEK